MSKAVKGELVAFGQDHYQHDPNNNMSYFVQVNTDKGEQKIWSVTLADELAKVQAKQGDQVILTDLGLNGKTRQWSVDKYEAPKELPNTIEQDDERTYNLDKSSGDIDFDTKSKVNPSSKLSEFTEFEWQPPDSVKNNYVAIVKNRLLVDEKINYYDKDDKDQVNIAFEDRNKSLHTSRQDDKTVSAMLDMAQSKGWSAIKLKGTEEFKQKAWLEASLRGIETKGYTPSEKDLAQLQAKQAERTTNQVEMTAIYNSKNLDKSLDDANHNTKFDINSTIDEKLQDDKAINYKEIAKDIAIEAGVTVATPTPLQPIVAGAFLAKDTIEVGGYLKEKYAQLTKDLKQEVVQTFQNGYKDGTIKSRDELVQALQRMGYEVKENEKSVRVTSKDGTAITLKNEVFTKQFDEAKALKDALNPDAIKANHPNIKDVDIANITAYKNNILEQYKTPQAQHTALSQLNKSVQELASGKQIDFPTLPPNEVRPTIEVRVPESGEKSRSK